ncbi:type IV secretory pathway VirB10-like protein [Streptomyces sp. SAI-208]|jgi:hypothetical protein|uniref:DNA primase n=1 Tax=unclassified Streptomyces TaxID=2593676 RepID=UPI0024730FE7|nr:MULTISPECIES: DNA primase [unclassified Streptomyces]MDH6515457.1 type IV secretory pathway VirB10-like protein [Streptomyces sp. SAI-090]MDH6588305.1 type IV secretory pathway VirB10-like protein [Streptomyces sp. SAI-133]MDH6606300.1 type IV secretory pathway VirB10-like protein [Streptomyces sp. SAI-208]MDH6620456.1 type IV secretory pathway VirB10-like protein [Streptomyces sp. SAI-135]
MNRVGLGLAVGAGYVLGRTKKLKLAFAVGSVVAGKKMHLSPRAVADLVSQQLLKNPQFKEIGDTLREDLRGVGKAASGAMVERQIDAIADRLHGRTAQVRDQLSGVAPEVPGLSDDEDDEPERDEESEEEETGTEAEADEEPSDEHDDEAEDDGEQDEAPAAAKKTAEKAPAKKTAAKKQPGRKPPAKKTAQSQGRTAGKKTAAKKTTAKKAAAKKTTAARGAGRSTRSRLPKGGGE